jgi:uncharacterized membrane protein
MNAPKMIVEWPSETVNDRIMTCITLLFVHGILTDSENVRAIRRLKHKREREETDASALRHSVPVLRDGDGS